MRRFAVLVPALSLVACGGPSDEERAERNAAIANFSPPFEMSRLDFGGVIERRFRRLDINHDDRITPNELPPKLKDRMRFDTDRDGAISISEWSQGQLARFDARDMNDDGTLTSDELHDYHARTGDDLPTPADEPGGNTAAD